MNPSNYADYLFMRSMRAAQFDEQFGSEWIAEADVQALFKSIMRKSFVDFGYDVDAEFDGLALENLGWLLEKKGLVREGDNYTGVYYKLNIGQKDGVIDLFLGNSEVANRIKALGERALITAINNIAREKDWQRVEPASLEGESARHNPDVPASDRIVTFSDNQITDLDAQTSEVIALVAGQNQIDGEVGLREVMLGQLKAGRELIRAGSFRLYIMELTLLQTLRLLAARYEHEAIGALATTLIVALAKHIGIDA